MSIPIIDQLRPLGDFPAVDASDVQAGNQRLSTVLSNTPTTTYVDAVVENKVDKVEGKGLSTNDYTAAEKSKLSGIEANANNYVHPTTAGNKHIPAGGSAGKILGWASDGTAQWVDDHNTEYNDATTSTHGLMSAADKAKLNGIAAGATNVTVDNTLSSSSTNAIQNKAVYDALALKANTSDVTTALAAKADNTTVSAFSTRVSNVETEQIALDARMDTFTQLAEGSTTGDAELIDGRVDYEGNVYSDIGGAIRESTENLNDMIKSLTGSSGETNVSSYVDTHTTWAQGVINSETGVNVESDTRIRSNFVQGDYVRIDVSADSKWFPVFYESDGSYVSGESWHTGQGVYKLSDKHATQVRFVLAKNDDSTITTNYSSNAIIYNKPYNMRNAMFRGSIEDLSYTALSQCVNAGYYAYTYTSAQTLSDLPDEFRSESGVLEVFTHLYMNNQNSLIQRLITATGKIATRYIWLEQEIVGPWSFNRENWFVQTIGANADLDDFKTEGYFTISAEDSLTCDNFPENLKNSGCVVEIFGNVSTYGQPTWYQYVKNSKGIEAFRYIRYYGSKSEWRYLSHKDGFTWYALGDSITEGYYSTAPNSMAITEENWVKIAAEIMGCKVVNYGIGGSGFLDNVHATDHKNAKQKVDTINFANCDLVTIAYGVNDWKYGYPLGNPSDSSSAGDTVMSNMKYVIEKIISDNPRCKIVVVTPLNCRGYNFDYGDEASNYGLGYTISENGKTLTDFYNAMKSVCEYYGVEMIDNTHNSVVNRKSIVNLLKDGVHPSLECHKALGCEMAKKINFE